MHFSIFQNPLNTWKGSSLLIGLFEENIYDQLKQLNLSINPDLLAEKINQKNFKGEKGQSLNLELFDQKLQSLLIMGLGEKNNFDSDTFKNSLSGLIRKIIDKEEKLSILLP